MPGIITIELKEVRFHAHHGLYAQETLVGNDFEVDVIIKTRAPKKIISSIDQTINYAAVYELVKEEMQLPRPLLETVAMSMAEKIKTSFPSIHKITIRIKKLHPPITSFEGSVGIRYEKRYKDD